MTADKNVYPWFYFNPHWIPDPVLAAIEQLELDESQRVEVTTIQLQKAHADLTARLKAVEALQKVVNRKP